MKHSLAVCALLVAGVAPLGAADAPANPPKATAENEPKESPETILAKRIAEITSSESSTPEAREEMVLEAVKNAMIAATENLTDPGQIIKVAVEIAAAASGAAPQFAKTIEAAAASVPKIANLPGASARIQAAISQGINRAQAAAGNTGANSEFGGSNTATVVSPSR